MSNTPRNPGGPHQDGCPHQDAVIARFLDGDACPPAQVPNEVLDLHLLDCPDCRLALEQARMLDALVARSADLPGAGEAVEPPGNQPDAARITAWLREAETRATADAGTATTAAAARPRAA